MEKIKLGDVCSITSSKRIFESEYVSDGVPFIRGQEISNGSPAFNDKFSCYISNSRYEELKNKYGVPQVNDILITAVGTVGNIYFVADDKKFYFKDGNIIWLRNFHKKIYPVYLSFFMKSPLFKSQIKNFLIGSVQKALTIEMLSEIQIQIPPMKTQKKIGAFLYLLDKKIFLNNKINSTLEAMAKTLYLHKFFRKAANGRIGDIIIENPKSIIPVNAARESSGDFPFFTSGEAVLNWNVAQVDGRNIFLNTGGNVGINFYVGAAAYSTDTWSITAENLTDYLYLFLHCIKLEIGRKYFKGTALKHLQKDLLRDHKIYIPSAAELEEFNCVVQPCFSMLSKNLRENYRLAKLRDWLLPLLMNGHVIFLN